MYIWLRSSLLSLRTISLESSDSTVPGFNTTPFEMSTPSKIVIAGNDMTDCTVSSKCKVIVSLLRSISQLSKIGFVISSKNKNAIASSSRILLLLKSETEPSPKFKTVDSLFRIISGNALIAFNSSVGINILTIDVFTADSTMVFSRLYVDSASPVLLLSVRRLGCILLTSIWSVNVISSLPESASNWNLMRRGGEVSSPCSAL